MWLLIQKTEDNKRRKYVTSKDYSNLIFYINKFDNVKSYDDYHFVSISDEVIEFIIEVTDYLDWR